MWNLTVNPIMIVDRRAVLNPSEMLQYLQDNNLTIDLETMNPVEIPKDSASKMEAIFPYPAANVKAEHSLGANPKPSQFANAVIVSPATIALWTAPLLRVLICRMLSCSRIVQRCLMLDCAERYVRIQARRHLSHRKTLDRRSLVVTKKRHIFLTQFD